MKRLTIVAAAIAALFLSTAVFAESSHTHGGKARFVLSKSLVVGSTTLRSGEYKFECRNIGGTDYLVITFADTGKEAARVPCRPEQLNRKSSESSFMVVADADGTRKLREVRIKGETIAHSVVE